MNKTYKQNFLKAGSLAREVRSFGKTLIKEGASYNDVIGKINLKIKELGAIPAFPPQIALNEVAAHFLPAPLEDLFFKDEVIKLDIGVCYKGAIGDCAVTIDLSGKNHDLVKATEEALLAAEKKIKVGLPVSEIGKAIQETLSKQGFNPVKNLCGHGLGVYKIHTSPSIPNYDDQSKVLIRPGMTFAIEPFGTTGIGFIYETGKASIFSQISRKSLQNEADRPILKMIETYNGLPFSIRDLMNDPSNLPQIEKSLKNLLSLGIIAGYPPLVEKSKGLVAQAENSVLVDDEGQVFITTREN